MSQKAITDNLNALNSDVTKETEERVAADKVLTDNLNQEIEDRETADSTLQNNIDTEVSNREEAIKKEATAREAEDKRIWDNTPHLDSGLIPASYLPSYVDDVLEYNTLNDFPNPGETGKIYVTKDTNLAYRYTGSGYVEISKSIGLGETSSTAYPGNKGKELADKLNTIEEGAQVNANNLSKITFNSSNAVSLSDRDILNFAVSNNSGIDASLDSSISNRVTLRLGLSEGYTKGTANGIASLGADGKVPAEQLPENFGQGGTVVSGFTEIATTGKSLKSSNSTTLSIIPIDGISISTDPETNSLTLSVEGYEKLVMLDKSTNKIPANKLPDSAFEKTSLPALQVTVNQEEVGEIGGAQYDLEGKESFDINISDIFVMDKPNNHTLTLNVNDKYKREVAGGLATLDNEGKIPVEQLPVVEDSKKVSIKEFKINNNGVNLSPTGTSEIGYISKDGPASSTEQIVFAGLQSWEEGDYGKFILANVSGVERTIGYYLGALVLSNSSTIPANKQVIIEIVYIKGIYYVTITPLG